jgi:hypothetical protein
MEFMNLFHAKAQRRKGRKKKKDNFGISCSDSAIPKKEILVNGYYTKVTGGFLNLSLRSLTIS